MNSNIPIIIDPNNINDIDGKKKSFKEKDKGTKEKEPIIIDPATVDPNYARRTAYSFLNTPLHIGNRGIGKEKYDYISSFQSEKEYTLIILMNCVLLIKVKDNSFFVLWHVQHQNLH